MTYNEWLTLMKILSVAQSARRIKDLVIAVDDAMDFLKTLEPDERDEENPLTPDQDVVK